VTSEIDQKTSRLQEMLKSNGLAGILVNGQHNFAWLTGGRSNGIDSSRVNGASYLLIRADGKRFLIANNIELPRLLEEEVSGDNFEPISISWQEEKSSACAIYSLATSLLRDNGEVASDVFLSPTIRVVEPAVARCRYQLTEHEIERYRDLGRDASAALGALSNIISPGQSEIEIAKSVRAELSRYDITPVVLLVGADSRLEHFRHPVPTANVWKRNLMIAICARRYGLIASLSRMICVGKVPEDLHQRTIATATVNAMLTAATRSGASGADLYNTAAAAYTKLGFEDEILKHHQGGACGYRTRDWVAHPSSTETVMTNQAFAWNPSITGTKTELTGIVRDDGFEAITSNDGFPQIVTVVDGIEYYSPGVLSLSKGVSA
jgi:Xaa-Pro dipeptidase